MSEKTPTVADLAAAVSDLQTELDELTLFVEELSDRLDNAQGS